MTDMLSILWKPFRWFGIALKYIVQFGIIAWSGFALYFSNLPWLSLRITLAILFTIFGIWALWCSRRVSMKILYSVLFVGLLVWWSSILPTQDANWRPEVAVTPRAIIDGDTVRLTGFRNFEYRSRNDFTVHYEERDVSLSHLTGVDFYISYWMSGPVGHTFVSFIFDNAPPVSISIETRSKVGQTFDPLGSLFKQFELIYVVGDEHDVVGVRTNHRGERVYLYHLKISPENARQLFLVYLKRINELADKPEFYHLLSNSCTVNILRYANSAGRTGRVDIRHYLNGWIDSYLYARAWLNTRLPFDVLRQRSFINDKAKAAEKNADFSKSIRVDLPSNN